MGRASRCDSVGPGAGRALASLPPARTLARMKRVDHHPSEVQAGQDRDALQRRRVPCDERTDGGDAQPSRAPREDPNEPSDRAPQKRRRGRVYGMIVP